MNIIVSRYHKELSLEWDTFLSNTKNGLFLFKRGYMDYHNDRYFDHSLMIYKNEKLIALFPANENGKTIFSHQGLTFGGLLVANDMKVSESIEVLKNIKSYYFSLGFKEINYKSIPYIFYNYPCQEDLYALFRNDAVLYRRDVSSVIDLKSPAKYSESKRQAISKCKKLSVEVIENKDFTEYWKLLSDVLLKFSTKPVHTLEEINYLKQSFPEQIKLYEARISGELLAGVVIYDYKNVAHTQYMANSENGRHIGALDFVNSQLIENEFKDRNYYSFGISTENDGRILNEGLIQQKEMMGGRAVVHDFYKLELK